MRDNLKAYLDSVFASAAKTRHNEELREEIQANLYDKYDAYIAEGVSPAEAYRKTINGIGDISSLFEKAETKNEENKTKEQGNDGRIPLESEKERENFKQLRTLIMAGAVCLYILSVVPVIALNGAAWSPVLMFLMIAVATGSILLMPLLKPHTVPSGTDKETREKLKRDHAAATFMLSGSVVGYILCVCPPILFENNGAIGVSLMFLMIAASTVAIIMRSSLFGESLAMIEASELGESESETAENLGERSDEVHKKEKPKRSERKTVADKIFAVISGIYWFLVVCVYFALSFYTGKWWITWILFVFAGFLQGIAGGVYDLVTRKGTAGPIVKIVICTLLFVSLLWVQGVLINSNSISFNFGIYDDSRYEYGDNEWEGLNEDLRKISVTWVDGSVKIGVWDEDYISISEVYTGTGKAVDDRDDQMRYMMSNGTLDVREYSPELIAFGSRESKELVIMLPENVQTLKLHIVAVAANVEISGLTRCEVLDVECVSGNLTVTDSTVRESDIESVSGNISFYNCAIKDVDIDTVSGEGKISFPPDVDGFEVEYDSLSGSLKSDHDIIRTEDGCRFGDRSIKINFDSVSGDLNILVSE